MTPLPRPRRRGVCPLEIRVVTPLSDEAFRRALPALDRMAEPILERMLADGRAVIVEQPGESHDWLLTAEDARRYRETGEAPELFGRGIDKAATAPRGDSEYRQQEKSGPGRVVPTGTE